jgi:cytochrome P450
VAERTVFEQVLDPAARADPYPLYARLRERPVWAEPDGSFVVSRYRHVAALLHDPRLSSEPPGGPDVPEDERSFLFLDPPAHDRIRGQAMRHFGPPHSPRRVYDMIPLLARHVDDLLDGLAGRDRLDVVDEVAYPFPVTVICDLLGVPREDEPLFHPWADAMVAALDPAPGEDAEQVRRRTAEARRDLSGYLVELARRRAGGDDDGSMFSGLVRTQDPRWRMTPEQQIRTAVLLLVAGHETTVNLLANGMLTLLRHPDVLDRLRTEPGLAAPLVEELLRYEPPVQLLVRRTLDDVAVDGTTVPRGARLHLAIAAANRDPERFPDPDRFRPDRPDNQHVGFGSGIHSCFGAPMARLEVQVGLTLMAQRLVGPRLVEDPPPYRPNALLRGPRHLPVTVDGVRDRAPAPAGTG